MRAMRKGMRRGRTRRGEEDEAEIRRRALRILRKLKRLYPGATTELHHESALELLVATILAAQATDASVNKVVPVLFARYPDARAIAAAPLEDLERIVHSTGFYREKAKRLKAACEKIVEDHGGEVPSTMDGLLTLPGVARKTANVVLGTWFGRNEGVVVDTHVGRVAMRLSLAPSGRDPKDAVRIEEDLMRWIPRKDWTAFGHAMTLHGRRVCTARKPNCVACAVSEDCPSAFRVPERGPGVRGKGRSAPRSRR